VHPALRAGCARRCARCRRRVQRTQQRARERRQSNPPPRGCATEWWCSVTTCTRAGLSSPSPNASLALLVATGSETPPSHVSALLTRSFSFRKRELLLATSALLSLGCLPAIFCATLWHHHSIARFRQRGLSCPPITYTRSPDIGTAFQSPSSQSLTLCVLACHRSRGRIRVWHRGGGHRKIYRIIDFKRHKEGKAIVQRLEYDPNRSATIALLAHDDTGQLHSYIICPQGVAIGEDVYAGTGSPIKRGSCLPLSEIPIGTRVHNIELQPGKGGQLVRAAGTAATVVRTRADGYAQLRLRSGEQRLIHSRCKATIGTVSNEQHQNRVVGKAGINRLKGWRPVTRGVAMNPVDHPHGGGEGRTSGGRPSCSPWGVPTKGYRTRKKNSVSSRFIVRRPKSKPAK